MGIDHRLQTLAVHINGHTQLVEPQFKTQWLKSQGFLDFVRLALRH